TLGFNPESLSSARQPSSCARDRINPARNGSQRRRFVNSFRKHPLRSFRPGAENLHFVDGGYFDNSGLVTLSTGLMQAFKMTHFSGLSGCPEKNSSDPSSALSLLQDGSRTL